MDSIELMPGMIAQLNSGGPLMTIEIINNYDIYTPVCCVWFSANGNLRNGSFNYNVLKIVNDN